MKCFVILVLVLRAEQLKYATGVINDKWSASVSYKEKITCTCGYKIKSQHLTNDNRLSLRHQSVINRWVPINKQIKTNQSLEGSLHFLIFHQIFTGIIFILSRTIEPLNLTENNELGKSNPVITNQLNIVWERCMTIKSI